MNFKDIKIDLIELLDDLALEADQVDLNQVRYFVHYNELKLAIETLCEYIDDDGIILKDSMIIRINHFCNTLNIEKIYWLDINAQKDL